MSKIKEITPGFLIALTVAIVAVGIEYLISYLFGLINIEFHIGGSVIALFIGMTLNIFIDTKKIKKGLDFSSKRILKFAIILLGLSLSFWQILEVGKNSLIVMVFTLLTCFGGGYIIGRLLKIDWKISNLISAGTGICGGSAIAAISPVIEANDNDVAVAMSATFIFDMIMIILFPIMGVALGMTDEAFGLWAGTAVNDTSSVVAAATAFSPGALDYATMVKMTRTLSIIPVVIVFSFISLRVKRKEALVETDTDTRVEKQKINFMKLIPWFILGFLLMSIIKTVFNVSDDISNTTKSISSFLMVIALASIGLKTNIKEVKSGAKRPMIHGLIISTLVVIVALLVQIALGGW